MCTDVQANRLIQAHKKAEMLAQQNDFLEDIAKVNLAAVLALRGQPEAALQTVTDVLPFIVLDRPALAFAHLIGASALQDEGRLSEASYWCSVAFEQAASPAAKPWRVPILCLWSEIHQAIGQPEQALSRLDMAARRARDPLDQFHVQRSLTAYWNGRDDQKYQYHMRLATSLATTYRQRSELKRQEATTPTITPMPTTIPVHVNLLGDISIRVDGVPISAVSAPRAALLLAFLVMNDGELLDEVAAQILPPDTEIKLPDTALANRVARVRQHVSQARRLLGDPAAIICKERRLWLNRRYVWEVDLQQAILTVRLDAGMILPILDCPWLQEIRHTTCRFVGR